MGEQKHDIIRINGKAYDAASGLALDMPTEETEVVQQPQDTPTVARGVHHAAAIHNKQQKSQTLHRRSVVKPAHIAKKTAVQPAAARRSPMIRKFADITPARSSAKPLPHSKPETPHVPHPIVQRVAERQQVQHTTKPATTPLHTQPAEVIKKTVIEQALASAPSHNSKEKSTSLTTKHKKPAKKFPKAFRFASASLGVLLLVGYFSYLAMPNISVRIAAVQAGVDASYPGYHPDGYSLSGPVAYNSGQVSMEFAANGGPSNFKLTQANSNWDSTAVETNFIQPEAGDDYQVTKKQGLTIYTYGTNAAWVNKGIFYTLTGDATLTSDQIARLATSM